MTISKEELKKSVEQIVAELLAKKEETPAEETVEKSLEAVEAKIEEVPAVEAQPVVEAEEIEKAKKEKKEDDEDEDEADEKKDKKNDKKPAFMKKSDGTEETIEISEEEMELVKAWRENKEEITIEKAQPAEDSELKKAFDAQKAENESLKKSLSETNDLIKSLNEKVEKMATQPAYEKRSVSTIESIEKPQDISTETVSKSMVLDALFELQKAGKATSLDITKYEATKQLNKSLQEAVKEIITNK